jgi:hypothetical protein
MSVETPTVLREEFPNILPADVRIIPGNRPWGVAGGGGEWAARDSAAPGGRV